MKKINILDCTLRDGSYIVDFQFTAEDTFLLSKLLEECGLEYIEVGHGLGLNASNVGKGSAASSDDEYLEKTRQALTKAKFGMFFIPGIGRPEDIELAAKYNMDFIRIGTNVTESEHAKSYVELAKSLGMLVCCNLMKSYALPPEELERKALELHRCGTDVIYIVDSAGGMMPEDVDRYVGALCSRGLKVGFHGHNNLGLAVANSLQAIKSGATFIDVSLMGLGRSAGNAPAENMVALLERLGRGAGIDFYKLMDIAENYISPVVKNMTTDAICVTSGYAKFHSSFLNKIMQYADKYNIDPKKIIVGVSKRSLVDVTDNDLEAVSQTLKSDTAVSVKRPEGTLLSARRRDFNIVSAQNAGQTALDLLKDLHAAAKKKGLKRILVVTPIESKKTDVYISRYLYEDEFFAVAEVATNSMSILEKIVSDCESLVDRFFINDKNLLFLDMLKLRGMLTKYLVKDRFFFYDGDQFELDCARRIMFQYSINRSPYSILVANPDDFIRDVFTKGQEGCKNIYFLDDDFERLRSIKKGIAEVSPETDKKTVLLGNIAELISLNAGIDILILGRRYNFNDYTEVLNRMEKHGVILNFSPEKISPKFTNRIEELELKLIDMFNNAFLTGEIMKILSAKGLLNVR